MFKLYTWYTDITCTQHWTFSDLRLHSHVIINPYIYGDLCPLFYANIFRYLSPFYAHIWRSLISPYRVMPIFCQLHKELTYFLLFFFFCVAKGNTLFSTCLIVFIVSSNQKFGMLSLWLLFTCLWWKTRDVKEERGCPPAVCPSVCQSLCLSVPLSATSHFWPYSCLRNRCPYRCQTPWMANHYPVPIAHMALF